MLYKEYEEMLKNYEGNKLYNEILNSAIENVVDVCPGFLTDEEVYALMDSLAGFEYWPVDIDYWNMDEEIDDMRKVDVSIEYVKLQYFIAAIRSASTVFPNSLALGFFRSHAKPQSGKSFCDSRNVSPVLINTDGSHANLPLLLDEHAPRAYYVSPALSGTYSTRSPT